MSGIRELLPPFVSGDAGIGALLDGCGGELDRLEEAGRVLSRRAAASIADDAGLRRWERELGLPVRDDLPPDARRPEVLAALDFFTTSTPRKLREMLTRMTGGTVTVTEDPAAGAVAADVVTAGHVPPDLCGVQAALRRTTPAHLQCSLSTTSAMTGTPGGRRCLHGGVRLLISE